MLPIIQHVLREANRCADKMVRIGRIQNERLVKVLVPPAELVEDLLADLEGVAFPRGFSFLVFVSVCFFFVPFLCSPKKKIVC